MRSYLDHNATSPLHPAARRAMLEALEDGGNPSSVHAEGRAARRHLDDAREAIARAVGALPGMVVFTSGGSEANNLALKGVKADRLLVSAIEHPSVFEAAMASGKTVEIIPVKPSGTIDLSALEAALPGSPAMGSIMLANNETGVIQPVREVVALAGRHGARVHCDAVQALGKIPVNFGLLGADMLTVSAHKLGGPLGCGALVIRDGLSLSPLMHGGAQELRRRAGTENVPAIAGFAAVLQEKPHNIKALRDDLESALEGVVVIGKDAERLPNTTCFARPGMLAETLLIAFDLEGIAVSSGSACSSGKVAKSHVLIAMGLAPEITAGAIRISLGWNTTSEDIERFGAAWRQILSRQHSKAAA